MTRGRWSAGALLAGLLSAACGGGSPNPSAATTPPPPTTTVPPSPGALLFSDGFDAGDLGNWTSGGDPNSIVVVGGRVRSTENGNWIETRQVFSGPLRIEVDIEKEATRDHGCWDFIVDIRTAMTQGVVLFDILGVDGIGLYAPYTFSGGACPQRHPVSIPSGPNQGTATLTHSGTSARFRLANSDGRVLETDATTMPAAGTGPIRIWLAAYPDAPRYVDNVKVYVP